MNNLLRRAKNSIFNIVYPVRCYDEQHPFKSYYSVIDNQFFSVFAPKKEIIVAAHENVICTQEIGNPNRLYLYPDVTRLRMRHRIVLDEATFPGLISGSSVQMILLLPFLFKDLNSGNRSARWRMIVITDKCQVYHNQPDERYGKKGAETEFSESLIWDLPGNLYPSKNPNCEPYEYYNPFLPDFVYEYHPAGDSPRFFETEDKNGKRELLSRFYFPNRTALSNPFTYMGGYEPDYITSIIGSYLSNSSKDTAGRIVVFATTDGGKNWFAKYEFNDVGTSLNYGNALNAKEIGIGSITAPSNIYLTNRELIPSEIEGMALKCGQKHKIDRIRWGETIELSFKEEHGCSSGEIVALQGDSEDKFERALLNNAFSDGNYGNGLFYKIRVVDYFNIELYELVSRTRTNLPARHIHSINRVKDGFLVATGETYPNGWLLMINLRSADNWGDVSASESFESSDITETGTFSVIRLNTAEESIQRILGATLIAGPEPEIIYASDCSSMISESYEVKTNGVIISNSVGIFRGMLRDADDVRKYRLIADVKEPSYFFKVLDNCFVFSGQRGELAIGKHNGTNWHHGRLNKPLVHYMGRTLNYFVIDGMILKLK